MSDGVIAYVGMGSNLGDSLGHLLAALREFDHLAGTRCLRASRFHRTLPWGPVAQPDFINAVAELSTELSAESLLDGLLAIERRAGRERRERWGPRVLDLDLLLYGTQQIDRAGLRVPHPHLAAREFVLIPLAELAPQLDVPGHGPVRTLLDALRHRVGSERATALVG